MSNETTTKCDGCGKKVVQDNPYVMSAGWVGHVQQHDTTKVGHACSGPCMVKILRADADALEVKHARAVAGKEDHDRRAEAARVDGLARAEAARKATDDARRRQADFEADLSKRAAELRKPGTGG
jgi:hypothetical protein